MKAPLDEIQFTSKQSSIKRSRQQQSLKEVKKEQRPILTYYYIRGLSQPIRNLLYYLNIDFDDIRLDKNSVQTLQLDKLQSTFNSGLPTFKVDNLIICDSVAINLFICKKYGAQTLLGTDIQSKSKINEVLFKYWMEKKKIMPEIAEIIRTVTGLHEQQKGVMIRQFLRKLVKQTRFINFCLKNHSKTETWVFGHLTLVDFYFYQTCFYINGFFHSYIQADEILSNFVSFYNIFEELSFHKKHCEKKTKLFFPFKNDNLREIIISAWQGDEGQDIC